MLPFLMSYQKKSVRLMDCNPVQRTYGGKTAFIVVFATSLKALARFQTTVYVVSFINLRWHWASIRKWTT